MRTKTQLEIIQALQRRRHAMRTGFTLIELMIVVAIIGILSAVALPQFLRARDRAQAGAAVGEVIGIAKECAVGNASRLFQEITNPGDSVPTTCDGTAVITLTSRTFEGTGVAGVPCLTAIAVDNNTIATVTIDVNGAVSCVIT